MKFKRVRFFFLTFIGILIVLFVLNMYMLLNGMGDESTSEDILSFNRLVNYMAGFPIVLFDTRFPLLLPNSAYSSPIMIILVLLNTTIQAFLIMLFGEWLKKDGNFF